MRSVAALIPARIRCQNQRGPCELRYRDVVRVTISAVWSKCCDDVRPDPSNMSRNFPLHLNRIGAVQVAIDVIEKIHTADSQFPGRCVQFRFTSLANRAQPRPLCSIPETAPLAARRRHQVRVNTFARVLREGPAHSKRFVVGMRENAHQSKGVFHSLWFVDTGL